MKKAILPIVGVIVLICAAFFGYREHMKNATGSLEEFYKKNEVYLKKGTSNLVLPDYMNYEGIETEQITLEEAKKRASDFNATCGLEGVEEERKGEACIDSLGDNYIAYINNGIPYYLHLSKECDADGACTDKEGYYDVIKFSFIKTATSIISKVDQYNGVDFAFELKNGDVYYFTPLFDAVVVDGEEKYAHLVKVNKSAKLKSFSNVENGQITYGTEVVLELTNGEKYVLEYDYKTNKITLTKYDEYVKKIEATEDEEPEEEKEVETKPEKVVFGSTYMNGKYKVTVKSTDGGGDVSTLTIKDLNDKVLYKNDSVKSYVGDELTENKPYVLEGKLYFTSLSKDCYTGSDGDKVAYVEYNSIDLESSSIKVTVIKKTKDYVEGYVGNCGNDSSEEATSIKCGDTEYSFDNDAVNDVTAGTAWTDGGIEIKYELSSNKLMYTLNGTTKQLNNMTCQKLFNYNEASLSRPDDTNAIPAGICYTGTKYYEIGLTVKESVGDNEIQLEDFIPYADEITKYCK